MVPVVLYSALTILMSVGAVVQWWLAHREYQDDEIWVVKSYQIFILRVIGMIGGIVLYTQNQNAFTAYLNELVKTFDVETVRNIGNLYAIGMVVAAIELLLKVFGLVRLRHDMYGCG